MHFEDGTPTDVCRDDYEMIKEDLINDFFRVNIYKLLSDSTVRVDQVKMTVVANLNDTLTQLEYTDGNGITVE